MSKAFNLDKPKGSSRLREHTRERQAAEDDEEDEEKRGATRYGQKREKSLDKAHYNPLFISYARGSATDCHVYMIWMCNYVTRRKMRC